ncbi:MAG: radical SAM protein, partial [Actinomycetia bacterium]|nr:radical SAM protein [Actinomycetes bacterium]
YRPYLIVVDTSTPSIYSDINIADLLQKRTGAFVILTGTHVSALPEETLKKAGNIQAVAVGEYDETISELAAYLKQIEADNNGETPDWNEYKITKELTKIRGLALKKNKEVIITEERDYIEDLDKIPWVSRIYKNFFRTHLKKYFYGANRHPVIVILSRRGCPYKCTYCVYPQTMTGNKYRFRSVNDVVDELEYIKKEFLEVKEIFLEDDTLTVNKERALQLAKEIIKRKLKITWSTNSRADADYETLNWLKRSGLRLVCVGFESGDQEVLNNIGKNLKVEQTFKFAKDARKAGVLVHGCFLVGNRGDTKETLKKTLALAKKLNPDTAQFYPIMVYPGTEAYHWMKKNNYLITENYNEWL